MVDNWPVKFSTRLLRDNYSIMPVDEGYPEEGSCRRSSSERLPLPEWHPFSQTLM